MAQENELSPQEHYKIGYQDCLTETMNVLTELECYFPTDVVCLKLMNHLQKYYEKITNGSVYAMVSVTVFPSLE